MKITNITLILILIILICIIIFLNNSTINDTDKAKIELPSTHLDLWEVPETTAPANLDKSKPYHSLDLETLNNSKLSTLTAGECYNIDSSVDSEILGNYEQKTNNYKRGTPDSCSALRHELVGSFYKN
jgi:hypothetical protein